MQKCNDCKIEKSLDSFGKNSQKKNGISSRCYDCSRIRSKAWKDNNKERSKNNHKEWKDKNPDYYTQYNKEYNKKSKVKERAKELRKKYYNQNKDIYLDRSRKNRIKQLNYYKEYHKQYRLKDLAKAATRSRNYTCKKIQAMLSWLSLDQINDIEKFYRQAAELTKETGIQHQVDHIVPLQGKNVCGLHVPWNLQILTATENRRKSNK